MATKTWLERLVAALGATPGPGRPATGLTFSDAFDGPEVEGLQAALDVLEQAWPSIVTPRLLRQVRLDQGRAARSAVSGLRDEGPRALVAVPTLTAWIALAAPGCDDDYIGYGLREAAQLLVRLRAEARAQREAALEAAVVEALDRLLRFFDEVVEPVMVAVLRGPWQRVQRGAVAFLDAGSADPETAVQALLALVDQPLPRDDGDYTYTLAEATRALQKLVDPDARPGWSPSPPPAPPPRVPQAVAAPVQGIFRDRVRQLASDDPSPVVRVAALEQLVRPPIDAHAHEILVGALDDPDAEVRAAAVRLGGRLSW